MLTKLSAMAAAAAAPAVLFLSAGTAQADVSARVVPAPGGVDVIVWSWGVPTVSGWCTYTSTVRGNPLGKPLPAINVPFYLPERGEARLWFPSYPTNSTWDISVTCPGPGGGVARITQGTTVVW
jgi:hypothetical protein